MNLSKKSKILNLTHRDLDGCGCSIVLGNVFDAINIEYRSVKYSEINNILEHTSYDLYDYVIVTDVHPSEDKLIETSNKIILIDHHDTALTMHKPEKFRFVTTTKSATLLTKNFCEAYFNINLSYLNAFVDAVNDYDMWLHNNPNGKKLNALYYKYWDLKFRRRFFDGTLDFNNDEIQFLKEKEKEFENVWKSLEIYPMDESIKMVYTQSVLFINDVCEKLLREEGYKFVICRNPDNGSISVRTKETDIHIGNILKELGYGGGHAQAGGINPVPMEKCQKVVEDVVLHIRIAKGLNV